MARGVSAAGGASSKRGTPAGLALAGAWNLQLSRTALGLDHLAEGPPEMRERRVGDDRVHLEGRIGVEHFLLALDDELVLHEALHHAVAQRKRDGRIVQVVVVQVVPEE